MTAAQISWAWQAALASVVALALLWWLARGARRWGRARSLRHALARAGGATVPTMGQVFGQAREALQPGTARLRPQALYAQPWMLFLGDGASRVGDLLRAAAGDALRPYGHPPASFWRWWVMPGLVAIETDPQLVGANAAPGAHAPLASWYQSLLILAERRGAQPLDAVALCVDAQSLRAGPEAATELAARLRLRADEASQHLRLRLSAQVLVTGLDQLPGYGVVRAALPGEVLAQAVGFRMPAGTLVVIDDVLEEWSRRVRALHMALLRQQADAPGRLAVHEFFTHWLSLREGLGAFLRRLFLPSAAPFRLRGRGLYFVAAPPAGEASAPAFVADLFERFLSLERAFPTR